LTQHILQTIKSQHKPKYLSMKKFNLFLFAALMGMLFNASSFAQPFTSGFETWTSTVPILPTDWYGSKSSISPDSVFQYTPSVHGGNYACQLRNITTNHKRFDTKGTRIIAGKTYKIHFWVRGHGEIRTGCYKGTGSGGAAYYTYNPYILLDTLGWKHCVQTITVDTTSDSAQFIFSIRSTNADKGHIQIDDVSIDTIAPTISIYNIQYSTLPSGDSPYANQNVTTSGIVTESFSKGYFIQNGIAPWNGLYIYDSTHAPALGDSIKVTGTVFEYYHYTELKNITEYYTITTGNLLPASVPVTATTVKNEMYEGMLVNINDAECTFVHANGWWKVQQSSDTVEIGNFIFGFPAAVVGTHYDVTGLVFYYYDFRIFPRDITDIQVNPGVGINESSAQLMNIYPNPASEKLFIGNIEGIDQVKIFNSLGENILTFEIAGNSLSLNVSKLPGGIYYVTFIKDNSISGTRKFIKQ